MRGDWSAMKRLIWLRGNPATGGGIPEVDLTVTGTPPLSLPNAVAKPLISLTQYGKLTLSDTPSPSSPATAVCNRGSFCAGDGELPKGYRRLIGITMNGATYYKIDDLKLEGSDTVNFAMSATAACNVFGCYTNTTATNNYSLYISTTSGSKYLRYGGNTYKSYWSPSALGEEYWITISPYGSYGMPEEQSDEWDEVEFTASSDMCIGTTSPTATSAKFKGNMIGVFSVDGKFWGIPCERVSDGAIGYYDTVGETFYAPIGTAPVSMGYDVNYISTWWDNYESVMIGSKSKTLDYALLSCGDVTDEYEFVSGVHTERINMIMLNGEETYSSSSTYGATIDLIVSGKKDVTPVCTHFAGIAMVTSGTQDADTCFFDNTGTFHFRTSKTSTEFAAWVKQQMMDGTPVVVFVAKPSESTSTATGWDVTLAKGTNTVTVASETSPTITAIYKGKESA